MRRRQIDIRRALFLAVIISASSSAELRAGAPEDEAAKKLEKQLKGRVLTFRKVLADSRLRFDSAGALAAGGRAGHWSTDGSVELQKLRLKSDRLTVEGNRVVLRYDPKKKRFDFMRDSRKVVLDFDLPQRAPGRPLDLLSPLKRVFLFSGEIFPEDLPAYWKPWVECLVRKTKDCDPSQDIKRTLDPSILKVGGSVTAPKIKSRVEPRYTQLAKDARLTGLVKFFAIVSKAGRIENMRIIQPLGLGLDEAAAEALAQWTFEPARSLGETVSVQLRIEVNFDLQ
jgi:TonB family protein